MAHKNWNWPIIHTASMPFWSILGTFMYGKAHKLKKKWPITLGTYVPKGHIIFSRVIPEHAEAGIVLRSFLHQSIGNSNVFKIPCMVYLCLSELKSSHKLKLVWIPWITCKNFCQKAQKYMIYVGMNSPAVRIYKHWNIQYLISILANKETFQ